MKALPISVVIASVGGDQLFYTIDSIVNAEFVPAEIIICLPPAVFIDHINSNVVNIRLVNSDLKGQVKQRIFAYQFCTYEIVMQSDDDIYYDPQSFYMMYEELRKIGTGAVLAPFLYDFKSRDRVTKVQSGLTGLFKNIFDSFISLTPWGVEKMGKISKIGLGYGVDANLICQEEVFEVSWLPGACSMCFKKDLILKDYYPFPGKAFGEDILQSLKRSQIGIKMYILPGCKAYLTEMADQKLDRKSLISYLRAHRFILKEVNGNVIFFYIWAFIYFIKTICVRAID